MIAVVAVFNLGLAAAVLSITGHGNIGFPLSLAALGVALAYWGWVRFFEATRPSRAPLPVSPNPYQVGYDSAAELATGADIPSLERWIEMAEERVERMQRETPEFHEGIMAALGQLDAYRAERARQ